MPTPPTDPYGVDVALDATGDLRVTPSGSLALVGGPDNMAQAVFMRLETPQGDLPLHPEYGSQLARRAIGAKMQPGGLAAQLNSELQTLLATDPRFVTAQVVQVQQPAQPGAQDTIQLGVQATLVGGEQLTVNPSDPTPADVSVPQIIDPSTDPTLLYDPTVEQEFFADQPEIDTLDDLNQLQAIVNDTPIPGG